MKKSLLMMLFFLFSSLASVQMTFADSASLSREEADHLIKDIYSTIEEACFRLPNFHFGLRVLIPLFDYKEGKIYPLIFDLEKLTKTNRQLAQLKKILDDGNLFTKEEEQNIKSKIFSDVYLIKLGAQGFEVSMIKINQDFQLEYNPTEDEIQADKNYWVLEQLTKETQQLLNELAKLKYQDDTVGVDKDALMERLSTVLFGTSTRIEGLLQRDDLNSDLRKFLVRFPKLIRYKLFGYGRVETQDNRIIGIQPYPAGANPDEALGKMMSLTEKAYRNANAAGDNRDFAEILNTNPEYRLKIQELIKENEIIKEELIAIVTILFGLKITEREDGTIHFSSEISQE